VGAFGILGKKNMQQQLKTSAQVLDIQEALILVKEMGSHSSLIKSIHATVDS
jgi:hypothetical protein